jgi:hypothetical protein
MSLRLGQGSVTLAVLALATVAWGRDASSPEGISFGAPENTPLAQEREALTIEAQAAKPSLRAAATERARAFMRAYPQSPYRARIRAIVFESE